MTPELGKYATEVLSSYGVSIAILLALTGISLWRSRRIKAALDALEEKLKNDG